MRILNPKGKEMATRTILVDDIDGSEATDTLEFSWGGDRYSIDLNDKNADDFREMMALWIGHATRRGAELPVRGLKQPSRGQGTLRSKEELTKIREWANLNGHKVSDVGRIPMAVMAAYDSEMADDKQAADDEAEIINRISGGSLA